MSRRRWVQEALGTTVTLAGAIDDIQAQWIFDSIDEDEARFSRFLAGSELSRFARGELDRDQISADLRQLLTGCESLREATDGAFEHEPRGAEANRGTPTATNAPGRRPPILDPNAFAKGWIIDRAVIAGIAAGGRAFSLNAGGDVAAVGDGSTTQRIGIVDPSRTDRIAAVLEIATGAVATSGRYERGDHVRGDAHHLGSATVVGPTLGVADALATAALACGATHPRWWHRFPDYSLLSIDHAGNMSMTEGMTSFLEQRLRT